MELVMTLLFYKNKAQTPETYDITHMWNLKSECRPQGAESIMLLTQAGKPRNMEGALLTLF